MSETEGNAFQQMADELRVQAWLAAAEFRNPSLHEPETRSEVDALASMRDELRLQVHLGRMEAEEEWHKLEDRWRKVKHLAEDAADGVGESIRDLLGQIRGGYEKLRSE